ncbi:SDR family NAD(P)-dependent oxidoreductase, partial [Mesorhizobium japonicum]|uniref:SDR family NAD(P)-dependent oxidoreductase n=1 Tax=Mesorhizobium japonicum TaxID=2066070 RepID=UPI003B5CD0ED
MPATNTLSITDLAGKAVLVTGASTGIGPPLALAYAAQKSKEALHYNSSQEAAEKLAKTIRDSGGEVFLVQVDFSFPDAVELVVEDSAQHFGRL